MYFEKLAPHPIYFREEILEIYKVEKVVYTDIIPVTISH